MDSLRGHEVTIYQVMLSIYNCHRSSYCLYAHSLCHNVVVLLTLHIPSLEQTVDCSTIVVLQVSLMYLCDHESIDSFERLIC